MTEENRVKQHLRGISIRIHEMEMAGEALTDKEDKLWIELTNLIEGTWLINKPSISQASKEDDNRVLQKLVSLLVFLGDQQTAGVEFSDDELNLWNKLSQLIERYR